MASVRLSEGGVAFLPVSEGNMAAACVSLRKGGISSVSEQGVVFVCHAQ